MGVGVSVAIEAAQLGIGLLAGYPYRMTDVDDVLLNTLGAAIGYGAWRAIARATQRARPDGPGRVTVRPRRGPQRGR